MADNTRYSLYNIEPLIPLIDAGFTLLTPNLRLARRLKTVWDNAQQAAGRRVWLPLKAIPLEVWLAQRWACAVELGLLEPAINITEGHAIELWQQVIAQHQNSSGHYSLLRPSAAAALASQARETLLRWQVDVNHPQVKQEFLLDDDCSTFFAWQALFQARLDDRGLNSAADCARQLLSVADAMPRQALALLDFDTVPPLYQACIDRCSSELQTLKSQAQAGQRLARAFPDKSTELHAAARWAKQQHDENSLASVAIILPNLAEDRAALEHYLRREFGAFGDNHAGLPVNFSSGTSLDRVAVVRTALAALRLALSGTSMAEVVALFQSRFLDMPDARSALAVKFIAELFSDGREMMGTAEVRHRASQVSLGESRGLCLGQNLMALSQMRELRRSHLPSNWTEHFCEILDIWGFPGPGPLNSQEYQQVEMWYQLLEDFAAYDVVMGELSLNEALQFLGRCASRQIFQPQTADSPIQVLGMLEGTGLEFEALWLCGLQASTWPAPARPSPVIPVSLQRSREMPHATPAREWAFASALMERYECAAPRVNASYAQLRDGVPELPSPLLDRFEHLQAQDVANQIDARWLRLRKHYDLEWRTDISAPPVGPDEGRHASGGSGLVEDQSHCPFRAFAKRRLKAQPLGEFQVGLSASARGSLLHDALYSLWGDLGDSRTLAAISADGLDLAVHEAAGAALASIPTRQQLAYGRAYLKLEGRRLQTLLLEWVQLEKQRTAFTVLAREQDITLAMPPLEIKLRVDRIDRLADNSLLILDYKSGRSKVGDWLGERPSRPQLLLYGTASASDHNALPVAALGFAQVRARACAFVGAGQTEAAPGIQTNIPKLVKGKMEAEDWQSLNSAWQEILQRLVAEFVAGDAAVDPLTSSSCDYCGLAPLCRINDPAGLPE